VLHSKTKHMEVRYHFLRDNVEKGTIVLSHVSTKISLQTFSQSLSTKLHLCACGGNLGFVALSS
jgi:hypothetical protein